MNTQPDDLTEEQLIECALSAGFGHDPKQNTLWVTGPTEVQVTRGLRDFARAVLSTRQVSQITLPSGWRLEDIGPQIHIYSPNGKWSAVLMDDSSPAQRHLYGFLKAMMREARPSRIDLMTLSAIAAECSDPDTTDQIDAFVEQCVNALPLTDERIDDALRAIDAIAKTAARHLYGLPLFTSGHESQREKMRDVIRGLAEQHSPAQPATK